MPTPIPDSHHSQRPVWWSYLFQLCFVAGLVAVVLVGWPLACRLGQQAHSNQPVEQPQQVIAEGDRGRDEPVPVVPLLDPGEEKRPFDLGPLEWAAVPPPLPDAPRADEVFEQRLRAGEDELRNELLAVPEVRLLSDAEFREARAEERAAQERLQAAARAQREAARANANTAKAQLNEIRTQLRANPRDQYLIRADREALAILQVAQRASGEADVTFRRASARIAQEGEKIKYACNLRLHHTLERAAARAGLPLRSGPNCELAPSTAAQVAKLSKELRGKGFVSVPGVSVSRFQRGGVVRRQGSRVVIRGNTGPGVVIDGEGVTVGGQRTPSPGSDNADEAAPEETKAFRTWCDQHRLEELSGTVQTLMQMLQIEDEEKRLCLVRELSRIQNVEATADLAVRAVVDLSPAVRRAAVAALARRPWGQYGPVLLRGLRYPWPPVADHAAVALRALQPPEAVPSLVDLLDLPSPSAPVLDPATNQYTVRELVRLNHLRNCLLCHAPSANKGDGLVRGLVPTPGEPMPVEAYYESKTGDFIRADTTFLRQDFSITLPAEEAGPWPHEQRYDFVTRLRTLPPEQVARLPAPPGRYPQRDAVLYALRGLTGKDGGDSSARWRELLGLHAGKPEGKKERPVLDRMTASLTDSPGPR